MSWGVALKIWYEVRWPTVLFGAAMATILGVFAYVLPTLFTKYSQQFMQIEFVRSIVSALLGAQVGDTLNTTVMSSFPWVHPVVLTVLWAQAISHCSRMPAGEVDRGTIDIILALPVVRWRTYASECFALLCAGLFMVTMGWIGNRIGGWFVITEHRVPASILIKIAANMYVLYLAVGGLTLFVSACCDRRGRAVGIASGVVLASFFLSFLAQFWEPAKAVSFLSVMHYYKPLLIVRGAGWPVGDLLSLVAIGAMFSFAGSVIFSRRDFSTG